MPDDWQPCTLDDNFGHGHGANHPWDCLPSDGHIVLGGNGITHTGPADRNTAMVFQSHALYPNMTVAANIAFPLEMRGVAKPDREATGQRVN